MNFLKMKTTWTNAELIPLKLCIAAAYILVGGYFYRFVSYHYVWILVLFAITMIWAMYLWITKMKNGKQDRKV